MNNEQADTVKPKVLSIEEVSGMGGSTACLSSLIKSLVPKGYDCKLVLYFNLPEIEQRLFPDIKTYHLDKPFYWLIHYSLAGRRSLSAFMNFLKLCR